MALLPSSCKSVTVEKRDRVSIRGAQEKSPMLFDTGKCRLHGCPFVAGRREKPGKLLAVQNTSHLAWH